MQPAGSDGSGTRAACNVADMSQPDLDQVLEALAAQLAGDPPRTEDGEGARLVALLPCEPAIGEVAVACWQSGDGSEAVELVRLRTGAQVVDQVALRKSLNLLAMVETLEELASFELAGTLADELDAWAATHLDDAPPLRSALDHGGAALRRLVSLAPGTGARVARPGILDALGGAIRELERTWEQLEQAAEQWSDARLAATGNEPVTLAEVQELWRLLGTARGGPLRQPASAALHAGREAGTAMASAIAEAMRTDAADGA